MKSDKNNPGKGLRPTNPAPKLSPDQGRTRDDALRILARMIAQSHIRDLEKKRLIELGVRPKLFIERIYIALDCVDMNDPKERQKLHRMIDEAMNEASLQDLPEKSPPLVLKKNGIRVRIYC